LSYPPQPSPNYARPPRTLHFAFFITGGLWLLASMTISTRAAQGIATRFNLPATEALIEQLFFLFLLLTGFSLLHGVSHRAGGMRAANALPQRPTTGQEVLRGAALGWAMVLIAVMPMMLTGALHLQFWLQPLAWGQTAIALLTLAVGTLALEVAFRGYLYQRLIACFGAVAATILVALISALISSFRTNATGFSIALTFCMAILFAMAYLRTHALWLGWGLHFGWAAAMTVLLGLPLAGDTTYNNLVTTTAIGPVWLTGGNYGPEAALFTLLVVLVGIAVLYRVTRDYAWDYTHPPIVPAAYAVVIAPPAAHTAMENAAAAAPAPLVQILSSTPTASSTLPVIDERLRRDSELPPDA
jgi:membrane protease YdiL (CAAX protease family)